MPTEHFQVIKKTSLISAFVNFLLAAFKVFIGSIGHSQALIADGIHSLSDLLTDGLVMLTAKLGQERPDDRHPYGHRRIETLGTILIAIIIIGIGIGLAVDSIEKWHDHHATLLPSPWVLIIAAVSIVANEGLFRYLIHHSKKIRSALLESNAWHNRSDMLVSAIVLIGAALQYTGLHYIDLFASILIAAMIFRMGANMISKCVKELIDTAADQTTQNTIKTIIEAVPGVVGIHHLRTRLHSGDILLDAHLQVDDTITVSEGHLIGDLVMKALYSSIENMVDITIHIDAEDDDEISPEETLKLPTRETILTHMHEHIDELPHLDNLAGMQLHYINSVCRIELIFPATLSIQDPSELLAQYNSVLAHIPKTDVSHLLIKHP